MTAFAGSDCSGWPEDFEPCFEAEMKLRDKANKVAAKNFPKVKGKEIDEFTPLKDYSKNIQELAEDMKKKCEHIQGHDADDGKWSKYRDKFLPQRFEEWLIKEKKTKKDWNADYKLHWKLNEEALMGGWNKKWTGSQPN